MDIFRGPSSTDTWEKTDSKPLAEWGRDWNPDNIFLVDATIDKDGGRHTDIGIRFDQEDIESLVQGFLKYILVENRELKRRVAKLTGETGT